MSCKYDSKLGATYDLTKLQELSEAKPAMVHDRLQANNRNNSLCFAKYNPQTLRLRTKESNTSRHVTCVLFQVAQMDYVYTFGVCTTVAPPPNCVKPDGTSRVVCQTRDT